MGLALTTTYVSVMLISLVELFPFLAPFRIQVFMAGLASIASTFTLLSSKSTVMRPQTMLLVGFIGSILLSRVMGGWVGGIVPALEDFLPNGIIFFLVVINCISTSRLNMLRLAILAVAVFLSISGLRAYSSGVEETPWVMFQPNWVDGEFSWLRRVRALGVLNDPNDFAQFLTIMLAFLFLGWRRKPVLAKYLVIAPIAGLFLYTIYLTRSRGAFVGLVFLVGIAVRRRMNAALATASAVVMAVLFVILNFGGGRAISVGAGTDRLDLWSDGLGMFKSSPLWGVGFKAFADEAGLTAHNSFLLCFAELGLIGYFFWLGMIVVTVLQINSARSSTDIDEETRDWIEMLSLALYTFLVTSFFLSRTYAPHLYLLIGMCTALYTIATGRVSEVPRPWGYSWAQWTALLSVFSVFLVYIMVRLRVLG